MYSLCVGIYCVQCVCGMSCVQRVLGSVVYSLHVGISCVQLVCGDLLCTVCMLSIFCMQCICGDLLYAGCLWDLVCTTCNCVCGICVKHVCVYVGSV